MKCRNFLCLLYTTYDATGCDEKILFKNIKTCEQRGVFNRIDATTYKKDQWKIEKQKAKAS